MDLLPGRRIKTGMTIDEAIETIKGNRWIACSEKYQEAMNLIETTMRKYQKIEQIYSDWNDGRFSDAVFCLRVKAVLNGNDD